MENQTFFENSAQALAAFEGQAAENFLAAVYRDDRSGATEDEKINFILNLEIAAKGINEIPFSKGHIAIIGKYEYFIRPHNDGQRFVYRAPIEYPVMPDGYRAGRWAAKESQRETYMAMIREFAS